MLFISEISPLASAMRVAIYSSVSVPRLRIRISRVSRSGADIVMKLQAISAATIVFTPYMSTSSMQIYPFSAILVSSDLSVP